MCRDFDLVGTDDLFSGPELLLVFATDGQTFDLLDIKGIKVAAEGVESNDGFACGELGTFVLRAAGGDLLTEI